MCLISRSIRVPLKAPTLSFSLICIITQLMGCEPDKRPHPLAQAYLSSLKSLPGGLTQSTTSSARRVSIRLPTVRERRFKISAPPSLNIRDYFGLSGCDLNQQIAYRNSPLGRSMLPSQQLAYQHRFLQAADKCELQGPLRAKLDKVIQHKRERWPRYHWNAIWGGRAIEPLFSQAGAARGSAWSDQEREGMRALALLTPRTSGDLSAQLEGGLSKIPPHLAGRTLADAQEVLGWLSLSAEVIRRVKESAKGQSQCQRARESAESFARLKSLMNERISALSELQSALAPLLTLTQERPSEEMKRFVDRWLSHQSGSALNELRSLNAEVTQGWSALAQRACARL